MTYDRREFLRRAGLLTAGATAAAVGSAPRPAAAADDDLGPFAWGVASGDPTATSVTIWTRLATTERVQLRHRIFSDVDLTQKVDWGYCFADPANDGCVKVEIKRRLTPGTWYYFDFIDPRSGKRSIVGRTKTLSLPETHVPVRLGVTSCSNLPAGYFNVYARLAERDDLDAIVHLGDYVYEGGSDGIREAGTNQPPREMVTLADYRQRYASYRLDPDLRRLHQLYPWITVWDDHESTNNSWRDGASNHNDGEGSWADRKRIAQQVYSEWLPIRTADPAKIYRTFSFGKHVELTMLDTRLEGRDQQAGTQGMTAIDGAVIDDPARQLISPVQRQFLFDSLDNAQNRGATWKIIGQQVMFAHLNAGGLPDTSGIPDAPTFGVRRGGNALNPDQWDGYTAERRRVLTHIRGYDPLKPKTPKPATPSAPPDRITNVVILTGDIHTAWAIDVSEDPYDPLIYNPVTGGGSAAVEFVTASVTSSGFEQYGDAVPLIEAAAKAGNPHIKYADLDDHGYFVLHADDRICRADFYAVDTVQVPTDVESLKASFQTTISTRGVRTVATPPPVGTPSPGVPTAHPGGGPGPVIPEVPAAIVLPATALAAGAAAAGILALRNRRTQDVETT